MRGESELMMKDNFEETATNVIAKEEEDPVRICFCAVRDDGFCDWYVIKSDDTSKGTILSPAFSNLFPVCGGILNSSTCVALGSLLYVIGGIKFSTSTSTSTSTWEDDVDPTVDDSRQVFYMDTLNPGRGWTRCPPMTMERVDATVFTLHGKIYVVGGVGGYLFLNQSIPFDNYAEVFDPEEAEATRCWRPALGTNFPNYFREASIDSHQIHKEKNGDLVLMARLVNEEKQLLLKYNFNTQTWGRCAEGNFGTSHGARNVLFHDDIFYSYVRFPAPYLDHQAYGSYCSDYNTTPPRCSILCFDSNKPEAKPKEVIFSEKDLDLCPHPFDEDGCLYPPVKFLHLCDSKFCLLWNQDCIWTGPNKKDYQLVVMCLKFTVSKQPSHSSPPQEQQVDFVASNVSKSTYYLNAVEQILDAIAIPSSTSTST